MSPIPDSPTANRFRLFACLVLTLLGSLNARGQNPTASMSPSTPAHALERWFDLQSATVTARYRYIENSAGETTADQIQHQDSFRGRLKLDSSARYTVNAGVFSGANFTGSWNDTGVGTGHGSINVHLKQLYFAAQPVRGVEFQYGGLYIQRGDITEITSYDNDAYIVGERMLIRRPKQLYFDEIEVTYAYLGDLNRPDLPKRFHHLAKSNYHHFLVSKNLGKRTIASADYTFQAGVETLRQSISLRLPETRVVDSLHFEEYERLDVHPAYGFEIYGEKKVAPRFTLGGGYAQIDRYSDNLNADRFQRGKRIYGLARFSLTSEITLSTYLCRGLSNDFPIPNRIRAEALITYDIGKGLKRLGWF